MKVLIMGAGGQGAPAALIFSKCDKVESVKVADYDAEVLKRLEQRVDSDKLETCVVDATDIDAIAKAAEGVDVVVDVLASILAENVMQAAARAGAHYVNSAFDEWLYENQEEKDVILGDRLKYEDQFLAAGKTAIIACGYSPGMSTNVVIRKYSDDMDTVENINLYLIKKNLSVDPALEAMNPWNPGWNPRMALEDQLLPKYKFKDGKFIRMEEPFAEAEVKKFPEPFGEMLVAGHCHEETYGMPHYFAQNRGLKSLTFKYYIDKALGILLSSGLASSEKVQVGDVQVSPIDLMTAITPKPSDAFFSEDPADFPWQDENVLMSIICEVEGTKAGQRIRRRITSPDRNLNYPRQEMYDRFGTSIVGVALPLLTGSILAAEGRTEAGILQPHELDPDLFLDTLRSLGYEREWNVEEY